MMWRRGFAVLCSVCLLGEGLAAPALVARGRRADAVADADNEVTSKELTVADDSSNTTTSTSPPITSAFNTDEIGSSLPSGNSSSSEASPASSSDSEAESSPSSSSDSEAESSNPSPDAESRSSVDFTPESSPESSAPSSPSSPTSSSDDDDDDDEDFADLPPSNSGGGGGGSNLFSLINLAGSLFPASSGNNAKIRNMMESLILKYQYIFEPILPRRDNKIEIDYVLKPPKAPVNLSKPTKLNIGNLKIPKFTNMSPFKLVKSVKPIRQEKEESDSDSNELDSNEDDNSEASDENDASEESVESNGNGNGNGNGNEKQESNEDNSDYEDEPPGGGDGEGGGLLGLLAGLSGGEDGQSDLGSLLATVGGIVANLSGDGFDLNAVVATALGLFVGLLSEGNENPGTVIANYLLTSLDTITEGGAQNNGAFFGNFISKLVKGTSAVPAESSEDENMMKMPMADSAGFLASFLSALLGEMSKGSSGGWES